MPTPSSKDSEGTKLRPDVAFLDENSFDSSLTVPNAALLNVNKRQRKSKILEYLDSEVPKWLSGPLVPNTANLLGVTNHRHSDHLSTMQGTTVQGTPSLLIDNNLATVSTLETVTSSKPSSKRKRSTQVTPTNIPESTSGIENNPEAAKLPDVGATANTTEADALGSAVALPLYSYKQCRPAPAVVYTQHEEEANDLVETMKGPLGFDLEWVVIFRRGKTPTERRTALVQLCDARMILLVQISAMKKFPQKLKEIIENEGVIKIGANIRNDGQKLFRDFGLLPANLVELGALARQADPTFSLTYKRTIVALAKVVERYTCKTLDKGKVRTSNWEAKLTPAQITYAANDAHCALAVYNRLIALAAEHRREIQLEECAADLAREYRAKTAAASASASASRSAQTSIVSAEATTAGPSTSGAGESALQASTSMHAPPRRQLTKSASTSSVILPNVLSQPPAHSSNQSGEPPAQREPPRPQHLLAYNMWHLRGMALHDICVTLRSRENPLAESTVISYVVRALQADPALPFSPERLKAFVQLEAGSWARHRDWILAVDGYTKT